MSDYEQKEQEDRRAKCFRERARKNKRIDRYFYAIELAILGLTITLCYYDRWPFAIVSFVWLIDNLITYGHGCTEYCIDEIDMPDSAHGLRKMFKGWLWLFPLMAVGVGLILLNWLVIAAVYGFFAALGILLAKEV